MNVYCSIVYTVYLQINDLLAQELNWLGFLKFRSNELTEISNTSTIGMLNEVPFSIHYFFF